MNNYPPNDPNNPYSQPTTAGPYPQSGQFGPPPGQMPPQKEWYQKPFGIVLMLLFFFPLGLYLMWKYATWPKNTKWVVTGIFAFCVVCGGIANAVTPPQSTAQVAATPTPDASGSNIDTSSLETAIADTPTPTPTPTATPTPAPTQAPVQQPAQLTVVFTLESVTDYADSYISVHTLPNAALNITVTYCSGRNADSDSLKGTQYADIAGDYMWNWTPQTTCRGSATAYVTASLNGQSASNSTSFTVS